MPARVLVAVMFLLASAAAEQRASWRIGETPPVWRATIARADLVVASLHDALLRELSDEFAAGGADLAIRSCHVDTVLTTQRLGREGIAAGRTSDRLRNPTNRPPWWAVDLVRAHAGRRARDVEGFAVDLGDRIGVLRPIAEREMCGHCHGAVDRLSPVVRAVVADRYPADRAIGFADGEIRGWFWVEMPKPR